MAELDLWDRSFRLWTGAPKSKYKAAIVASRDPEVQAAVKATALMIGEFAEFTLAEFKSAKDARSWSKSGISNLHIEVRAGSYTDWHVNMVANGKAGMSDDDVEAALWTIENGRRSYHNKFGRRIPALQGHKILAKAMGDFGD
jgi:hypothetical protein